MATCERRILTTWRAPPTASAFAIRLDFCDSPSRGGNRRACIDLLGGKVVGIGWPPHRISLRLTARLLRLPLKGGNRRACIDLLGGKVAGIGWPPHRISLRLRLDFCDSPSRGE